MLIFHPLQPAWKVRGPHNSLSRERVLFPPSLPKAGALLGVQESLTMLTRLWEMPDPPNGRVFKIRMEEDARGGLTFPSPSPNYGIHSDPVWGSSHASTLINICAAHSHICVGLGVWYGDRGGAGRREPLCG